jgi:hypothetical protein
MPLLVFGLWWRSAGAIEPATLITAFLEVIDARVAVYLTLTSLPHFQFKSSIFFSQQFKRKDLIKLNVNLKNINYILML